MERLSETAILELAALCPGGIARDVDLSAISQWRIGGRADLILRPSSTAEVSAVMGWLSGRGIRPVVIGLTSNLLFDDDGLRAPCIQIGRRMARVNIEGLRVSAQAGAWVPGIARTLMQAGLSGAEHTSGIPGTLGGLICMNGGSQRKDIGSNIVEVESVDATGQVQKRLAQNCAFRYRQSMFQKNGEIITAANLNFLSRPRAAIRTEMRAILADRRRKFPRKEPNCGSVFKSNPTMYEEIGPPGAAIESLGLKGKRIGDALVSLHHANFFVNVGAARADDMLRLIAEVRDAVQVATNYRMEPEVQFVTPQGKVMRIGDKYECSDV